MRTTFLCVFLATLTICTIVITWDVHGVLTAKSIKVEADVKNLDSLKLPERLDALATSLAATNDNLNKVLATSQSTLVSGQKLITDSQQSFDDNYYDLKATVANNTVSSKELADLLPKVTELVENADRQVVDLSGQASEAIAGIDDSQAVLAEAAKDVLKAGTATINNINPILTNANQSILTFNKTEAELADRVHTLLFPPKLPVMKQIGIKVATALFPDVLHAGFSFIFPTVVRLK